MSNKLANRNGNELEIRQEEYINSLNIVEDIVFNKYIKKIDQLSIVPFDNNLGVEEFDAHTRIFKINKVVYSKDEDIYSKMTNVLNTLSISECTIYLIIDSDGINTDIYMGIRANDPKREIYYINSMFENALKGQFPGTVTMNIGNTEKRELVENFKGNNIAMSTSVPSLKNEDIDIQRLESFIESMIGKEYTAIIMANNTEENQIDNIRSEYENIYSSLSMLKEVNITEGFNESETTGTSLSLGTTNSKTDNISRTSSTNTSKSKSKMDALGKAGVVLGGAIGLAMGGPIGAGAGAALAGTLLGTQKTTSNATTSSLTEGESSTEGTSKTTGESNSLQLGKSSTRSMTIENKKVQNILGKIDRQFERLDEFENLGMWETATYFISEDTEIAEVAAANYNSLMRGNNSGVENIAINSWYNCDNDLVKYIKNFIHPKFYYEDNNEIMEVTGTSYMSGNELAISMGLPRNSVVGLPVIEYASFGKESIRINNGLDDKSLFKIGCINSMGEDLKGVEVRLDNNSLSQHTFITGSTGTGKSNTVYKIIEEIERKNIKFMVIEPAKGEYKDVFGDRTDVSVYGTNPKYSDLLRINPFSFPEQIHVYEHVDRITEIFNATWDLHSAMPAMLKDGIIRAYESCGWDLENSYSENNIFPNFMDLEIELYNTIESSGYSEEVKSNYKGALLTRVSSMTNGLNKSMFQGKEIELDKLFDENVIIDLSRIGSIETKSFIMGVLIMKLNEYRMSTQEGSNADLKHVTIIEEAHNILPAQTSSSDGVSIAGKSVEMISNSLSEMRTYGEGFIIVDQSPSSVDISAIKNTNTKIIMRLPEENDIRISGKSIGLNEEQVEEIVRLPMGVAAVYQNGWLEPVLCKIDLADVSSKSDKYIYETQSSDINLKKDFKKDIIELLLSKRVKCEIKDYNYYLENLHVLRLAGQDYLKILNIIDDLSKGINPEIFKKHKFAELSQIIVNIIFDYKEIDLRNIDDLIYYLSNKIDHDFGKISNALKVNLIQLLLKGISNKLGEKVYKLTIDDLKKRIDAGERFE